ncbi:MAG: glucose-6-phosphate dehydrogenase [Bacteroidetes bacterium]|nr:glucose-6-phosphate dehydrogenase [Bacteroidota bacterium]
MEKLNIKSFNLVIFGGDGDLCKRKILPALYQRYIDGQLNAKFKILCVSRRASGKRFFDDLNSFIIDDENKKKENFSKFINSISLVQIPEPTKESYSALRSIINENPDWQKVFYFSVPSSAYGEICNALKASELIDKKSKIVLEKPLGFDLNSSKQINDIISTCFNEDQIFRIDHYLGKETVQNLMVLRFANHLFEKAWNKENIENIQITVSESLGVESRGGYYDKTGALLDMVQNHLLQLLCLVCMEPPASLNANAVRNEKLKVLQALRLFSKSTISEHVVRGQYTRGTVGETKVNSYLEDIEKYNSETETYVAIKAFIDNWRWKGTPIYLRTGKRMKKRYSDIVINFKEIAHNIFPDSQYPLQNKLVIRLQPEERIELVQLSKIPGPGGYRFKPISLKLDFVDSFDERMPDAYERLLIDVLRGNQTLFMRYDELEAAWNWIESITDNWKENIPLSLYESGTWGPGDQILDEGVQWQTKYI